MNAGTRSSTEKLERSRTDFAVNTIGAVINMGYFFKGEDERDPL